MDTLDLYQAKQRQVFARLRRRNSGRWRHIQRDLGRALLKLEQIIEERAKAAEAPIAAPSR